MKQNIDNLTREEENIILMIRARKATGGPVGVILTSTETAKIIAGFTVNRDYVEYSG